jgi:hypothetical protein
MKIKKIVGACIAVASMALMSVAAQAAVYSVESVNANGKQVGDTVSVKVFAEPNDGQSENINGFAVKVSYDPAILAPVADGVDATDADRYATSAASAATNSKGVYVADIVDGTDGKKAVAIAWADKAPITVKEKSELVSVSFEVLSIKQSSTTLGITVVDSAESSTAKGTNTVKDGGISFAVTVLLGDADGNNIVDLADANLILRHLANLETIKDENLERANATQSDGIDLGDANLVLRSLAGLETIG